MKAALLVIYFCDIIAILVPLVYRGPISDASFIVEDFDGSGGWPSGGVTSLIRLLSRVFLFFDEQGIKLRPRRVSWVWKRGYDGSCHMDK